METESLRHRQDENLDRGKFSITWVALLTRPARIPQTPASESFCMQRSPSPLS